jgi:predicted DNA-binding transcriptional regulator YafY
MSRPATRLLALLNLLQSRGAASGADLARELQINPRTLRRYINQLEALGVPIAAERGRHGQYKLVPGYRLPPVMFSNAEAVAVALGLILADKLGVATDRVAVDAAQSKFNRVLPAALRRQSQAIQKAISIDLRNPSAVHHGHISLLSEATLDMRTVALRYRSRTSEVTTRRFDPYGLCYRGGSWYLAGFCQLRQGLRTLRLDRIEHAIATENHFKRPAEFSVADYITVKVLLHTDIHRASQVLFSMLGTLSETSEGVVLTGTTDDLAWFARQLIPLPFPFTVQSPQQLTSTIVTEAQALIARLSDSDWNRSTSKKSAPELRCR